MKGLNLNGRILGIDMSGPITRRLKPEEEELLRKREDLASIRATLAERELALVDLRGHLAALEGRYLRQVGTLYAELDQWKARIADLRAQFERSADADARAEEAHQQARETYENSHGTASGTTDFTPSPELKSLFREVAKRIHPDLSRDSEDQERRTRFMAEANRAYEGGDAEALQRILDEYQEGPDAVEGEGIGVELIRIIRQISMARARVLAIERELTELRRGAIGLPAARAKESSTKGRDLLAELAAAVQEQIELARKGVRCSFRAGDEPRVSDESFLQIASQGERASLSLPESRYKLIERGLRDAAFLASLPLPDNPGVSAQEARKETGRFRQSFEETRRLAEHGDAEARFDLGRACDGGGYFFEWRLAPASARMMAGMAKCGTRR